MFVDSLMSQPSEITPMTVLKFAGLVNEAGFPPGVVNIVNGYGIQIFPSLQPETDRCFLIILFPGDTVGQAISEHPLIEKIAFTGSTLTGRKILKASAESNLKVVSLELGGKSPTVIFDDADLDQAIKWASSGILYVVVFTFHSSLSLIFLFQSLISADMGVYCL